MKPQLRVIAVTAAAVALVIPVLAGCAPTGDEPNAVTSGDPFPALISYPEITVIDDVDYGSDAATADVCLPDAPIPRPVTGTDEPEPVSDRPAVLVVHGGSWRQGDKSNLYWRNVCEWLASEGFVTVSANYRLAPENPFPAAIDDLRTAVEWMRSDVAIERFDIDPERIGAFGGSAGGNLVALLGLEGEGDLDTGSRVAAVAELSGPVDLTTNGFSLGGVVSSFRQIQLDYLGCESYADCPDARAASPLYDIDPTDPPFFVGHSLDERIPIEQSDALVEELRENDVDVTYVTVDGTQHSIAMLDDDMKARISEWLKSALA